MRPERCRPMLLGLFSGAGWARWFLCTTGLHGVRGGRVFFSWLVVLFVLRCGVKPRRIFTSGSRDDHFELRSVVLSLLSAFLYETGQ